MIAAPEKPADFEAYLVWLEREHSVDVGPKGEQYYDAVTRKLRTDFETSPIWMELLEQLRDWHDEYGSRGYPLFVNFEPTVDRKPYQSFLKKTYRKNCVRNPDWPGPPAGQWLLPDTWFAQVNDLVRTYLVVKYLDGVEFVVEKMTSLFTARTLPFEASMEARVEGYYAAHVVVSQEFEIPRPDWDTTRITTSVEIQITTQLQEIMRSHLHKLYDENRLEAARDLVTWQWDYRSADFSTGYLAHILHYVEGMIVEIRDREPKGSS